ncbi:MAG TPA: ester cyclase [Thermomicrobiaceae bacterium]|nr:ester cyclase [Thermomicrobiaceae bacterium]
MSQTRTLLGELFAAVDAQDLGRVRSCLAPGFQAHAPGAPGPLDADGYCSWMNGFFGAFPDVSHTLEIALAEDGKAAARLTIRGTNRGSLQGMPPTGRPVEIASHNLFRITDGKIAEQWIQADFAGMLRQLGVMPG